MANSPPYGMNWKLVESKCKSSFRIQRLSVGSLAVRSGAGPEHTLSAAVSHSLPQSVCSYVRFSKESPL